MIETFTLLDQLNYSQQKQDDPVSDAAIELDNSFYEHISPQLNRLKMNPSEDTIGKILAYSRSK